MPTVTIDKNQTGDLWTQFAAARTRETFCDTWLALQCDMITQVRGGLVLLGPPDHGPFVPIAVWPHAQRRTQHLTAAAEQALQKRSSLILQRQAHSDSEAPSLDGVDIAYPIEVAGQLHGVVVIEVVPRSVLQLQTVLQQLSWGAVWLEVLLHRDNRRENVTTRERLQGVLNILATLLEHEPFYEAAAACVTQLATRLRCERVSLGFVRGHHVHLRTMSHSVQFGKKANLTRAIEKAMEEALDQQAVIVYPPEPNAAFQLTRMHEELAETHGAPAICSVPLSHDGKVFGVLSFERSANNPFDVPSVELCEAIAALAGPILEVKRREDRCILTKAAEALRTQLTGLIGPRNLTLKLACVGLAAVITFFAVTKADYRVTATTFIEAKTQRVAVAPFDGYIANARVRAGDLVQEGELLCALDDRDRQLERRKWLSQKEQYVKQYHTAMAQGNAAYVKIITAQIGQAEAELALVEDQLARAQIRAPFDGVIVKGDLSHSIGSPVERGEVLFEVAPLDTYRVVLQVDERDTAEVAVGQRGSLVLSALPTDPLRFVVEKMTPVSVAHEGRNYFRVEAKLEQTPAHLRPGMEGIGKIGIDRRLLLWNWTHRAIDWLRLFVWSWWP